MANEKKATELEKAVQEMQTPAVKMTANGNLVLERETFKTKDKREMYGYYVCGKVRGRELKADFVAKDQGGYETLDLIFDVNKTAELLIREESMVNADGSKTAYMVYEAQNVDEDGIVYKYEIKPAKKSDVTNLSVLLQKLEMEKAKLQMEKAEDKETA